MSIEQGRSNGSERMARGTTSAGLFLVVLSLLALSGPGRIDVVDGRVRYEVARSIVDYGDAAIHDSGISFTVLPGRDGKRYSEYRLPQSLLGVPAILAADFTGPRTTERRQFFFVLVSAAAAAGLSVVYLAWFRRRGMSEGMALFWAAAGIFCTPSWFYGTSTFDDILGTLAVVAAVVAAAAGRRSRTLSSPLCAGLLLGLAFNCKPPLAVFGLAAIAAGDSTEDDVARRVARGAVLIAGIATGMAGYLAFEAYKFPAGSLRPAAVAREGFPMWPGQPLMALLALAISPGTGIFWYSPTLPLCVNGIRRLVVENRRLVVASCASALLFVSFIASISFFKGDLAWGPRYLTPVFALLWLFVYVPRTRAGKLATACVLAAGFAVQIAALSVIPARLYCERRLPLHYGYLPPILYFDPANAHIAQRAREIREIWAARNDTGRPFAAAHISADEFGPAAIRRYKFLNSFRPWWAIQRYLPEGSRPVSTGSTLAVLLVMGAAGALMVGAGAVSGRRTTPIGQAGTGPATFPAEPRLCAGAATRPLLSVVMPTYNGERHVREALDSVLAQHANGLVEVIVIDDGSSDGTVGMVQDYAQRLPIRLLEREHRGNWVTNTNEALACASGRFVSFLHQDDTWTADRVRQIELAACRYPEADVILGAARFIDGRGRALNNWSCPLPVERLLDPADWAPPLLVQNFLAIPVPAVRLEAMLAAGPLDERLRYTADWKQWLKLALTSRAVVVPRALACFRVHGASQTLACSRDLVLFRQQLEDVHREFAGNVQRLASPRADGRGRRWLSLSRCSIEVNVCLAAAASRRRVGFIPALRALCALGPSGMLDYLRYSRVVERTAARLRAQTS